MGEKRVQRDWLALHYTGPEPFDNCDDCNATLPEYEIHGGIYCHDCAQRKEPVFPTQPTPPLETHLFGRRD